MIEGFLCPLCMKDLGDVIQLQVSSYTLLSFTFQKPCPNSNHIFLFCFTMHSFDKQKSNLYSIVAEVTGSLITHLVLLFRFILMRHIPKKTRHLSRHSKSFSAKPSGSSLMTRTPGAGLRWVTLASHWSILSILNTVNTRL